ncbi:hypothetical protein [Burkholderia lata]|uniref:hypothetical protein n=1 Tax=Burkholderia lata (strain ATCC 17760 / DSM 23089 / LMG 22485 / NCIMB 9086 / R18194 / 383) TaxID=482957 RepID=UPI0012FD5B53|nr:hypothetical protein [Burkholderia lata]
MPFLNNVTSTQLDLVSDATPIGLFPSPALRETTFDLEVVVHPSLINGAFTEETIAMGDVIYTVFPAYRCEFPVRNPSEDAGLRLQRIIRRSEWSRSPAPALRARFSLANGFRSANEHEMLIFSLDELERVIGDATQFGGVVHVENFEGACARFQFTKVRCDVELAGVRKAIACEMVPAWLKILAIDGAVAAKRN